MSMRLLEAVARNPNMWGLENNLMIGWTGIFSSSAGATGTTTHNAIPVFAFGNDPRAGVAQFQLTQTRNSVIGGNTFAFGSGLFGSNTPAQVLLSIANGQQNSTNQLGYQLSAIGSNSFVLLPYVLQGTSGAAVSHVTVASCSFTIWLKGNALGGGIPA